MRHKIIEVIAIAAMTVHSSAWASVEYLRFEGSIYGFYGPSLPGYDPAFGFQPGQSVFLDFSIDTEIEIPNPLVDEFQTNYLAGSLPIPATATGTTAQFAEGLYTYLTVSTAGETLLLGDRFDPNTNGVDESIETWIVGSRFDLLGGDISDDYIIGGVTLTYRDSVAPGPIVPLPGAALLFGSAIAFLLARRRLRLAGQ